MHAYLITGISQEDKQKKAEEIARKNNAKIIEFELQKIDDTRTLLDFIRLTPTQKTAILIKDIDSSSPESINAFLKNLEEKENYTFILTATNKYRVLPTLLSRCEVTNVKNTNSGDLKLFNKFLRAKTADRLILIDAYKNRVDAVEFANNILVCGDELLKADPKEEVAKILSQALLLKKRLSANTNPLLQLTNFVTSLDE